MSAFAVFACFGADSSVESGKKVRSNGLSREEGTGERDMEQIGVKQKRGDEEMEKGKREIGNRSKEIG